MPCVETKIVINGDSKPIFEIIKNMEAYPSFMHDLVSVEILERGENTTVSHWVSMLMVVKSSGLNAIPFIRKKCVSLIVRPRVI